MTPEELEAKQREAVDRLKTEAKAAAKEAATEAVKEVKATADEAKATAEQNATDIKTVNEYAELLEKRIKSATGPDGVALEGKSFLEEYTENLTKFASRTKGQTVEMDLSQKAAVTMLTPGAVPGRLVMPTYGSYVGLPNTPTHVRELLASGTMSGNLFVYPREVAVEGAPAITAEGTLKPKMSFTYEEKTVTVKKIPVYFKVSTELVADAPAFVSYMKARAAESIKDVEDTELLYGDGTSSHLDGIIPLAATFSDAGIIVPNAQRIDVLRLAVAQVRRAKYKASAILLNPEDAAAMELTKDAEGRYILPTILSGTMPQIGRVSIIEVDAINQGEFLVGAFDMGAQVFEREGLTIRMFDQNEDDAIKNLVTVVLEERLLQAVYRPASFVKGTFSTAITGLAS
jgi:HK97 family phage major capsid protein